MRESICFSRFEVSSCSQNVVYTINKSFVIRLLFPDVYESKIDTETENSGKEKVDEYAGNVFKLV